MNLSKVLFLLSIIFVINEIAYGDDDDYYYNGGMGYNPYNGLSVMNLPPPPPMKDVPFYVRDDYDDYVEDYYECILGYEHKGMVCRFWRKYAEKHGLYQKLQPQVNQNMNNSNYNQNYNQNNMNQNMNQNNNGYIPNAGNNMNNNMNNNANANINNNINNSGYIGNDGAYYPNGNNKPYVVGSDSAQQNNNQNNSNNNQNNNQSNMNNNQNVMVPYTPSH